MKVQTSRFGEIEVPDESLIVFPEGVIGFRTATRFVIFDCGEEGVFKWLQSVDRPDLAFVICDASLILPDYQVMIGSKERDLLQVNNPAEVVICLIMIIPEDPREATANLLGPILMNSESRRGMQLVVVNPEYSTRHRIFAERGGSADGREARHVGA